MDFMIRELLTVIIYKTNAGITLGFNLYGPQVIHFIGVYKLP